jgi:hypothetical protein
MAQLKHIPPAQPSATPSAAAAGRPLPPSLRHQFESQMGTNLSDVRVHEDHGPTLMGAKAYSQGKDIHFAPGQYQPHDPAGREMLGHELTHVVQQQQGSVRPTIPPGMINVRE